MKTNIYSLPKIYLVIIYNLLDYIGVINYIIDINI